MGEVAHSEVSSMSNVRDSGGTDKESWVSCLSPAAGTAHTPGPRATAAIQRPAPYSQDKAGESRFTLLPVGPCPRRGSVPSLPELIPDSPCLGTTLGCHVECGYRTLETWLVHTETGWSCKTLSRSHTQDGKNLIYFFIHIEIMVFWIYWFK